MSSIPDFVERRHMPDRRNDASHSSDRHHMKAAEWIPMLLLAIGGLNWGLVGLFDFDAVAFLFGEMSAISRAVYVVVGLSALYSLYMSSRLSARH
jgi:uncharacterized membrane protein YuzA (DUF378 family)